MRTSRAVLPGLCAALFVTAACAGGSDHPSGGMPTDGGLTGAPVVVGVQAPMEGSAAYPQLGYGAEAAVAFVNEELGGIGGRPLRIELCAGDGSPETAINCANSFVTGDVPVVYDANDSTVAAQVPVLTGAGIPLVGMLAGQGMSDALPNPQAYYFSGPLETSALGSMTILQQLGLRDAALLLQDSPAAHAYIDSVVTPISERLGVRVAASYTSTTSMNFGVLAATELASSPDVTGVITLPEDGCTGLFTALRRQGWAGPIFAGSCSQFIAAMGADAAGAIVQPRLWLPLSREHAPPEIRDQLDTFTKYMDAAGYGDELSARSLYSFAGLVDLARIMQTVSGEVTNTSVAQALGQVRDMPGFAGPSISCDGRQWPGRPAACSAQAIFFEVQADGTLKPVGGPGFIDLDPTVATSGPPE